MGVSDEDKTPQPQGLEEDDDGVAEEEDSCGEGEGGDEDEREDALRPIKLQSSGPTNLRAEEEEDRQDRGFLENLHDKADELPL